MSRARSFRYALGIAALVAANSLLASEWRPFGLQGTIVRSLASTSAELCAGTEGRGVWCLDRTGAAAGWTANGLDGVTITWLWIDPLDARRRFATAGLTANGPTLWRSADGGLGWTALSLPGSGGPQPRAWAVHGVPGAVPVFAAGWAVWVSTDLGDSWTATSAPGGDDCLDVAPTDPFAVWSGGETMIFSGFTIRSLDGGLTWDIVWDSRLIGDNQTSDVSAHPTRDGVVLTGHEGFVLRTENAGETFEQVLAAPCRFFLDWDGANPDRAYAAGSPNGGTSQAFVSGDLGRTWTEITGMALAPRTVFRLEADRTRIGVAYAATDDGVFRHFGGGLPVCHDARMGLDAVRLWKGPCHPIADGAGLEAPGPAILGDLISFPLENLIDSGARVELGEVECIVDGADVALADLDLPDPGPGRTLAVLARAGGTASYGASSSGKPRIPASGDCP